MTNVTRNHHHTCAFARRSPPKKRLAKAAAWILTALGLLTGSAKGTSLYAASPYNAFLFSNFTETGSDDGGRLAVGGNASFSGYYAITQALLDSQTAPGNDSLVVGGKVTSGTANVLNGNAFVGNTTGGGSVSTPAGTTTTGTGPINFAATQSALLAYSLYLSTLTANGVVTNNGFGTITLTGSSTTLNVFDINASLLGGSNTVYINDPLGSTVLINVIGTSAATTNAGIYVNGNGVNGNATTTAVDNLLFNYYQATSLTLNGGFLGSILAPNASVIGNNYQQLDGQLIANSFTGTTEFHDFLFTGSLPANPQAPEPTSMTLLGAGMVFLGLFHRMRSNR
jgi:choice-of-anchor A domain-containing protein